MSGLVETDTVAVLTGALALENGAETVGIHKIVLGTLAANVNDTTSFAEKIAFEIQSGDVPQTGDNSNMPLMLTSIVVSLCALILMTHKGRNYKRV